MALSDCCKTHVILTRTASSDPKIPPHYNTECATCNKSCTPLPHQDMALFRFEDGNIHETKYPKVPHGLKSNGRRPYYASFGLPSQATKRDSTEEDYKLWINKCKLVLDSLSKQESKQEPKQESSYTSLEEAQNDIPTPKPNEYQYGGDHYHIKPIQPWDYVAANNLGFFEGNAVKYLTRWKEKGGILDLKKAIHYIEKLIEVETKNETKTS